MRTIYICNLRIKYVNFAYTILCFIAVNIARRNFFDKVVCQYVLLSCTVTPIFCSSFLPLSSLVKQEVVAIKTKLVKNIRGLDGTREPQHHQHFQRRQGWPGREIHGSIRWFGGGNARRTEWGPTAPKRLVFSRPRGTREPQHYVILRRQRAGKGWESHAIIWTFGDAKPGSDEGATAANVHSAVQRPGGWRETRQHRNIRWSQGWKGRGSYGNIRTFTTRRLEGKGEAQQDQNFQESGPGVIGEPRQDSSVWYSEAGSGGQGRGVWLVMGRDGTNENRRWWTLAATGVLDTSVKRHPWPSIGWKMYIHI